MDLLGVLDAATDEFGQRLALVGAEGWALSTRARIGTCTTSLRM